jgi:hypothetical protein
MLWIPRIKCGASSAGVYPRENRGRNEHPVMILLYTLYALCPLPLGNLSLWIKQLVFEMRVDDVILDPCLFQRPVFQTEPLNADRQPMLFGDRDPIFLVRFLFDIILGPE